MSDTERAMNHEDARDALSAVALDALDAPERAAVLAHVAGCASCTAELAELRDAVGAMSWTAPAAPMAPLRSSGVRARLLGRAKADAEHRRTDAAIRMESPTVAIVGDTPVALPRERSRWSVAAPWLAAAAAVLIGIALARNGGREREQLRAQLAQASDQLMNARIDAAERERSMAALTGPGVKVVDLTAAGVKEPVARMFWDRATNSWTMYAYNLPKPAQGKTYELWLVTASAKIPAGTFTPDSTGAVQMHAQYALARDALKAIAVTEEPAGGVQQPTGRLVISGTSD